MDKKIATLFVPETAAGQGTGHVKRCINLAASCDSPSFCIPSRDLGRILHSFPELKSQVIHTEIPHAELLAQLVVILDKPALSLELVRSCLPAFRLIALDATGKGASLVPAVIDLLPRLQKTSAHAGESCNLSLPDLLFPRLKEPAQRVPGLPRTVAVSFGGEDPRSLRIKLIESGLIQKYLPHARVDIINGPATSALQISLPAGWTQTGPFPSLAGVLPSYDLLITSFGLTALEARAAGLAQVHLNPTPYHQKLSLQEGFLSLGTGKPGPASCKVLEQVLEGFIHPQTPGEAPDDLADLNPTPGENPNPSAKGGDARDFGGLVSNIVGGNSHACPACSTRGNQVLARFPGRTFFACSNCGITYQSLLGSQPIKYSESYFFDEYRSQYGKTYLEDFGHIKAMGTRRVQEIAKLLPGLGHALLDIGCAYGPFLSAARDAGFVPHGCDISQAAVTHVREKLGMKAWTLDFRDPSASFDPKVFDAVTLWYVIEHFEDLAPVFASLASLVRPGGILAFSTPSGEGISARARTKSFLDRSPMDHYTIWNPSQVSRLLEPLGFRVEVIRSTGHHPERFPGPLGKPAARLLSSMASQAFGLGDTFEIYARRLPGPVRSTTMTSTRDLPGFPQGGAVSEPGFPQEAPEPRGRERILILGAGLMQIPAIRAARMEGLDVVVADGNKDAIAVPLADGFIHVDLKDREGMAEAAAGLKASGGLAGVFTAATDFSATVAWVAEKNGLPGIGYQTALNASSKTLMRRIFREHHIPSPGFVEIPRDAPDPALYAASLESLKYPLVVKPVDNMGARGVRKIARQSELAQAVKAAMEFTRTGVIVEEFITGPEFSIDSLVIDGVLHPCGIADRHICFPPYFIEVGHTIPTSLSIQDQKSLVEVFARAVKALGIRNGTAKGDVFMSPSGPVIGEIAARLSGGYMSGWTFPWSSGIDLTRLALRQALGRPVTVPAPPMAQVVAERALIGIPGTVKEIHGTASVGKREGIKLWFTRTGPGSPVVFPRNNVEKCGNIIGVAKTRESAAERAESAVASLVLELEPRNTATDRFLFSPAPGQAMAFPVLADLLETRGPGALDSPGKTFPLMVLAACGESGANQRDWNWRTVADCLAILADLRPEFHFWSRGRDGGEQFLVALGLARGGLTGALYVLDSLWAPGCVEWKEGLKNPGGKNA